MAHDTTDRSTGAAPGWKREVLATDERDARIPSVVRFGPHVFVSGADGHRRLDNQVVDAELADQAEAQCANAYGLIVQRLERAGLSGETVVSVQNFTSGQHWRAQRMNQWPTFFGEENHRRTVSFGAQARMNGVNMLTAIAWAVDPSLERIVSVPSPARGRASRITRVADLAFVIGVRAHGNDRNGVPYPEEGSTSFNAQAHGCFDSVAAHLHADGLSPDHFVKVDAVVRSARFVDEFEATAKSRFAGRIPFAMSTVGMPLGARGEMEVGGVAAVDRAAVRTTWSSRQPSRADVTAAAGLAFVRNVSGLIDEGATGFLSADSSLGQQVRVAVRNVETLLDDAGVGGANLLRFDVFLRDIYAQDEVRETLRQLLGDRMPAVSFIGADPAGSAQIEISAIAGCDSKE